MTHLEFKALVSVAKLAADRQAWKHASIDWKAASFRDLDGAVVAVSVGQTNLALNLLGDAAYTEATTSEGRVLGDLHRVAKLALANWPVSAPLPEEESATPGCEDSAIEESKELSPAPQED